MTNSESECNLSQLGCQTQAADLTVAVQDYLKAIYALESAGERVTTSALARAHGRQRALGDRDDEAPRRARPRRARCRTAASR